MVTYIRWHFFFLPVFLVFSLSAKSGLGIFYPENYVGKTTNQNHPEVYETKAFTQLRELYGSMNPDKKKLFKQLLNQLSPAFSVVKYQPRNSKKGDKSYQFYNEEVWLYFFDKRLGEYMFVIIDDGFDGFIYSGEDNNPDRIDIYHPRKSKPLLFERDDEKEQITLKLETDKGLRNYLITEHNYRDYFNTATEQLASEQSTFQPF